MSQTESSAAVELEQAVAELSRALDGVAEQDFPWRRESQPFRVMLAEMMLIRTRADLVVRPYTELTTRYPTAAALASAQEEEVRAILVPLGLAKRIPFFIKAAEYITHNYPEEFPITLKELVRVPGIGRYTGEAVLAFAFDMPLVPADVNVLRWIARVTGLPMTHVSKGSRELKELLPYLSPIGGRKAYKVLDFIRNTCRARRPRCTECPIRLSCRFGKSTVAQEG